MRSAPTLGGRLALAVCLFGAPLSLFGQANDTCVGAIAMTAGQTYTVNTAGATSTGDPTPGCQGDFGKGVWYTIANPFNFTVSIDTCGSDFDTVLAVYTGNCGSLIEEFCNDQDGPVCAGSQASVSFNATAGTVYWILAGGKSGASGTLRITATVCRPPDLQVHLDTTLVEGGVRMDFSALGPGTRPFTYLWTFFDKFSNQLFTSTNNPVSRVFGPFDKVPASVQVLAFNACGQNGNGGTVPPCSTICLSLGSPSTLTGTAGSGSGPVLNTTCGTSSSSSKWFRMFSTNTTGTGIVSTEGSTYDTVLAVYRGEIDDTNSLVLVTCTNSLGVNNYLSRLQFAAQPTTNYWLVVDKATSTTGSLVLKYGITTLAPPTLDPINNPSPIGEAASLQTVNFSGTGASPPANTLLTVTASSSNPGLIPSPTVNYTSPSATGSLSYTPVANASGSAMITVTVRDAGQDGFPGNGDDGTTNRTFTVVVNPTNDRPRFISHSLSGGTFQFRLVGNPGSIFVIETSGTLTNWTALSTNSAPSGSFDGSVPVTTTRYLRARLF